MDHRNLVRLFVIAVVLGGLVGCANVTGDSPGGAEGAFNLIGENATVGGGSYNSANARYATIGGGSHNLASVEHSTVSGGVSNTASATRATIGGGYANVASMLDATIGGGGANSASGTHATVGGGSYNAASGRDSTIAGGYHNEAFGTNSVVCGGARNVAFGFNATVGGGSDQAAEGPYAFVGGGLSNSASGVYASVSGGYGNIAEGSHSSVLGGLGNVAAGDYSFAAGRQGIVRPEHSGSFVFADSTDSEFTSTAADEFAVRATGGVRLVTAVDSAGSPLAGVVLSPGSGSWSSLSDRAAKTNLVPVDGGLLLEQLVDLPISTWSYLGQDPSILHLGPVAQDFHSIFGLGDDDRHISAVDADGVALAAIQGLYQRVIEQGSVIDVQQRQIAALEERVEVLEASQAGRGSGGGLPVWSWPLFLGMMYAAVSLAKVGTTTTSEVRRTSEVVVHSPPV